MSTKDGLYQGLLGKITLLLETLCPSAVSFESHTSHSFHSTQQYDIIKGLCQVKNSYISISQMWYKKPYFLRD